MRGLSVRILGPQPGATVRSGRAIGVIIQVSSLRKIIDGERVMDEIQDGEHLPPGWVLGMSHDGNKEQTVGRKVGHIGEIRELRDGVHSLRY